MAAAIDPANPGFEGVEKVLEIDFTPDCGPARGLREITRAQWDEVLQDARCTILDKLSNDRVDSYVLSESSLFVYPLKLIMKTCGTTTLLMSLPRLLSITKDLGMTVEWVAYTRKNFQFPHVQKFPHRDPQEEMTYCKSQFPEGHAFLMGPISGDHWFVFVADYVDRPTEECVDRTLDIMMFGLDESVASLFMKDDVRFPRHKDVTAASGIDTLLPGSTIQEFCFDPCGYSMNGLLYDSYWTIHITPESHCSYASFETNIRMTNYSPLIRAVLAIFRPRRFTITLFADEHGIKQMREMPFSKLLTVPVIETASGAIMGPCVLLADGNITSTLAPSLAESSSAPDLTELPAGDSPVVTTPPPTARVVLGSPDAPFVSRKGTMSYVSAHKSASEFMGYSCFMANYTVIHTTGDGSSGTSFSVGSVADALERAPQAATTALSMPRAKYAISKEIESQRTNKLRSKSEAN